MLVFDCTQAAAEFFSRKVNGKVVTDVQPGAAAELLPTDVTYVQRWQLHVTRFGRTNILLAMKHDTRYAMLFVGLKRNDVKGFLEQFLQRYFGGVVSTALLLKLPLPPQPDLQPHITALEESLKDVRFFKRSDRSVQGHMNEVLGIAEYDAYEGKGLPVELNDLMAFDQVQNRFPRTIRGSGYFYPLEVEILQVYPRLGVRMTEEEVAAAFKAWDLKRFS